MIVGGTTVTGSSKKSLEDLPQDGPKCSIDGLSAEDSTKGKPHNRILGGGCKTPSPPTRRCVGRQHTDRIDPDEHSSRQLWRNKGALLRCNHIVRSGRQLPITDRQGRDIPSGRLFIRLQCYPRATHSQFMEGRNFDLPPDD